LSQDRIKILVLGATGMLGHMVVKVLRRQKSFAVDATHLDARKRTFYLDVMGGPKRLRVIFRESGPYDYIINCIGMLNSKIDCRSRQSVSRAKKINGLFPKELAATAGKFGAKVIHISTDGVFGPDSGICREDKRPNAKDVYGRSKIVGEARSPNFLTIRTSVIGPSPHEKGGLFEWFAAQPDGAIVKGFTNQVWNGVTTVQFALFCAKIIQSGEFDSLRRNSYAVHFAPNKAASKYEILRMLKRLLHKNVKIVAARNELQPISRELKTKFGSVRKLYPHGIPMQKAIKQLVRFI
jgi:dTDP-4-dehydrorhamnose reductase